MILCFPKNSLEYALPHIEYLIDIYSCAHFVIEIDEKSSHNGGF